MKIRMCKRWTQVDILFTSPKHTHLRFFICKYLANDWENKASRQHMAAACLYPATSSLWSWCQFPDPVYVFWLGQSCSSILTHALTHTANNADFLSNCWWAPGQAPTTLRERRPWCVPLRSNFIKPEDRPETHGGQLDWDSFVLSWLVSKVSQRTELTLCAFFHE